MNRRFLSRLLLLLSALGALGCATPERSTFIFEIPEGYRGWVSVEFFRQDCPRLTPEGEKLVIRVPPSGRLCTGTPHGFGERPDEYYFVDATGKRTDASEYAHQPHVAIEGASPGKRIFERLFVGTDEDLRNAPPEPHLE